LLSGIAAAGAIVVPNRHKASSEAHGRRETRIVSTSRVALSTVHTQDASALPVSRKKFCDKNVPRFRGMFFR
jgi:hypothetical protein